MQELDVSGTYDVQSTIDLAQSVPGPVGQVVGGFIDATDDANDPTKWLLDQMIAKLPDGTWKSLLQTVEPALADFLNGELLTLAPQFVTKVVQAGDAFGDMAQHVGLIEKLAFVKTATGYTVVHTVRGLHFHIDTTAHGGFVSDQDVLFADEQLPEVVVNDVGATFDQDGHVAIAAHDVALSYGKLLHLGLDRVIVPTLDPNATDLGMLFADLVHCDLVGVAIANFVHLGSASFWQGVCSDALGLGANVIYAKIDSIDASALTLHVAGAADGIDENGDYRVDVITNGTWTGTVSYAGATAPLGTATFAGTRE